MRPEWLTLKLGFLPECPIERSGQAEVSDRPSGGRGNSESGALKAR